MATYKEISGTNIEVVSSDPANPVVGQVWYNTTTGTVKGASVSTTGAWATGGALNTPRQYSSGAGDSNSSALAIGGNNGSAIASVESYNGSAWTEVNDLNTARDNNMAAGTSTSALAFAGKDVPDALVTLTETWNGFT